MVHCTLRCPKGLVEPAVLLRAAKLCGFTVDWKPNLTYATKNETVAGTNRVLLTEMTTIE